MKRTRPRSSREMDSTKRTMGRSPSASRQRNSSPWSTKTDMARPPTKAQTKLTGAGTFVGTPRSSTTVFSRPRQNSFQRTSSSRFTPSVKTTQVMAPTSASSSSSATTTAASGFSSWSRGRQTASRADPTSSAPRKKFAPVSDMATGFGS